MQSSDRLHALDAVRAFALLTGVALHAAQPFVAGLFWVAPESPSNTMAGIWFAIHIFRMPLFFLIAGFFGRMVLERRGTIGFLKDRSRRIVVPLVIGVPLLTLLAFGAYLLGALAGGADVHAVQGVRSAAAAQQTAFAGINLLHLWFLYYLLIFYAMALLLRSATHAIVGREGRMLAAVDSTMTFLTRGPWGPLLLALPAAAYYCQLGHWSWSPWEGLPAPVSLITDRGALIAYGTFFAFGWLLHRQQQLLPLLEKRWPAYFTLAVLMWVVCRVIAGPTPHWEPFFNDGVLSAYALCYVLGAWYWSFGLIGIAMRFLSGHSPVRRYLADASYWIYLLHIPVLIFFGQLLHPLHWHWAIVYPLSMFATMLVLLSSYHYLVRFTFIGATLNGRRHRGEKGQPLTAVAAGLGASPPRLERSSVGSQEA